MKWRINSKLTSRLPVESLLMLICLLLFLGGGAVGWFILLGLELGQTVFLLLLALALLCGASFILIRYWRAYVLGSRRLTEEIKRITTTSPTYRIQTKGPNDMRQLAQALNVFMDRFQVILADQEVKALQARTELETKMLQVGLDLEKEKNRLTVLMSELAEGVLVCNIEGQILLYNSRAGQLLRQPSNGQPSHRVGGFVGLGHSVFSLLDRHAITHALEELAYRRPEQKANPVARFVSAAANGQLIRVRLAPVLDQYQEMSGFILTLEDITQQLQTSSRKDILLQSLIEGVRASLGSIRAAIETIEQYPEMDAVKLSQLRKVIYDESLTLSVKLNQTTAQYAEDLKADWQLEEMFGNDLLWAIQRRFEDKLGITTKVETLAENLWLKVDSYSIVQAMTYIMGQLKADFGVAEVAFHLKQTGRLAVFDMVWPDGSTDMEKLWAWQNQALIIEGEGTPLTLREVIERHGGEVWCQSDRATNTAYFRLLLPIAQPKPAQRVRVVQESRPEYFDFDLFHQLGQTPELDQQLLAALTYTVFDTETTGLSPSAGDEIISISAVRITAGRLLRQEIFDQLINPQRSLSPASINIHGILPEMLANQPTIEQVLPLFYEFAKNTILVAHNAAFDMRMLQLKETQTGLKFTNPVLDTLLLAAVVQPDQAEHSLEAIAQYLSINTIGRYTSLGDAMVTGEVLLKLIPLLAERGITTLHDARQAAQEAYHARLKSKEDIHR